MSNDYWIGLSDSAREGTWIWLNDNHASFVDGSLWVPGHPRTGPKGTNFDCAIVFFGDRHGAGICALDRSCSDNRRALCEKPV